MSPYLGISFGITGNDAGVSPCPGMRGERLEARAVTLWGLDSHPHYH